MPDAHSTFRGTIGLLEDVTDQHRILAELHASEERFRDLAERSPDIVAEFGPDLRSKSIYAGGATLAHHRLHA